MCALPGTGIATWYRCRFSKVRTGTEKQNTRQPPPAAAAKEGKALYEL